MADAKMQPCPKCDGSAVKIFPSWGGSGGNLTSYVAECPCGVKVDHLSQDGTKRGAIRDWNRWAKEQRRTAGVPASVPAGYVLMPAEPNTELLMALAQACDMEVSDPDDHRHDDGIEAARTIYKALLASAPGVEGHS